ncbi:MAG TPA: HdeA/HdeB family chaperone [Xanthobacteraceae bacterium]
MTRFIVVVTAVLLLSGAPGAPVAPAPADAQALDLAAIKCKEFLKLSPERIGFVLMWLDGYYTADEDPVVVDFDNAKTKANKLGDYCAKHPALNVITAAESVLSKP